MTGDLFTYARPIRMINKKICIEIPYTGFADSASYTRIIITVAVVASSLLFLLAILYQRTAVFQPLMKLKYAMEQFSKGNPDVVLEDKHEKNQNKHKCRNLYSKCIAVNKNHNKSNVHHS